MPDHTLPTQTRIALTRNRAALIVFLAYTAAAMTAKVFLSHLGGQQDDPKCADFMAAILGLIMLALCVKSLVSIYRRPKHH